MRKTRPSAPRYQVLCPACGVLEVVSFFGDACQYAQREQSKHAACGDLTVVHLLAKAGAQHVFDRFGETLERRA